MTRRPIYLDYHATTPVDPRVLEEMLPYFSDQFGNPHSKQHAWGWEAAKAIDMARSRVAALVNASAQEITFTSGASESNNLALKSAAECLRDRGTHVVTVATEHKSVLDSCRCLGTRGFDVTVMNVGPDGLIDLDELRRALTPSTILVSVMAANNEIGTLQPLAEIGAIAHEHGALLHTDAAQGAGKIPIDVEAMQIDLLSLTAHKMYGPKGSGALYVRRTKPKLPLPAQIDGGGQENGLRSGTLNVPGIVGLGRAAEICRLEMQEESARHASLRDRLLAGLRANIEGVRINGTLERRLPHNLHVSFEGVEGEALLKAIGDLAVSTGSACSSGSHKPSHVLQAIGAVGPNGGAAIRFGLGRRTTVEDIDYAIDRLTTVIGALRARHQIGA
jgi:cysteine desulfurase